MPKVERRQTELVDAKTRLPKYARDELDAKAAREGMRRSTYLRRLILGLGYGAAGFVLFQLAAEEIAAALGQLFVDVISRDNAEEGIDHAS